MDVHRNLLWSVPFASVFGIAAPVGATSIPSQGGGPENDQNTTFQGTSNTSNSSQGQSDWDLPGKFGTGKAGSRPTGGAPNADSFGSSVPGQSGPHAQMEVDAARRTLEALREISEDWFNPSSTHRSGGITNTAAELVLATLALVTTIEGDLARWFSGRERKYSLDPLNLAGSYYSSFVPSNVPPLPDYESIKDFVWAKTKFPKYLLTPERLSLSDGGVLTNKYVDMNSDMIMKDLQESSLERYTLKQRKQIVITRAYYLQQIVFKSFLLYADEVSKQQGGKMGDLDDNFFDAFSDFPLNAYAPSSSWNVDHGEHLNQLWAYAQNIRKFVTDDTPLILPSVPYLNHRTPMGIYVDSRLYSTENARLQEAQVLTIDTITNNLKYGPRRDPYLEKDYESPFMYTPYMDGDAYPSGIDRDDEGSLEMVKRWEPIRATGAPSWDLVLSRIKYSVIMALNGHFGLNIRPGPNPDSVSGEVPPGSSVPFVGPPSPIGKGPFALPPVPDLGIDPMLLPPPHVLPPARSVKGHQTVTEGGGAYVVNSGTPAGQPFSSSVSNEAHVQRLHRRAQKRKFNVR